MRHDLPSGAWIEIRPLGELKGKDRDAVERAFRSQLPMKDDGSGVDMARGWALGLDTDRLRRDGAIAVLVSAWSFLADGGEPLPVPSFGDGVLAHADSVGEWPLGDEDAIDELMAPYLAKLRRPDPKAVTTSASNGRSRAKTSSLTA